MKITITPGLRLFVDIEGAGLVADGPGLRSKPSLILLHGGPGYDHSNFKPLFSQLADVAQLVYVDHRGHGRSDACPAAEWTLDNFADDVVRLCDALGIDKPIVLGQSFGGFVAQRYIARHPAHPAKVILSSTSSRLSLARMLLMFERLGGSTARDAAQQFWSTPNEATWAEYSRICRPLYNRKPADQQASERTLFKPEILFHWVATEQQAMDLSGGLSRAQCPVLVMAGELDPVCPLADAQDIVDALPARWVQFERFADCGHGVWRDDAAAAMALLRRFIAAV